MNLPPAATLRLSDAEHRVIERDMWPRTPWTANEWRQRADNLGEALTATEDRAGLLALLLEDAGRELVRRQRRIDTLRLAASIDTLLIETLLEGTATCPPSPRPAPASSASRPSPSPITSAPRTPAS